MDFTKFDTRARAEAGTPMQILDPWSGEPMMDGDKPCRVIVRGTASKSIQSAMRAKQRAKMQSEKDGGKKDTEAVVMEDIHNQLCEAAAPYISGFENVSFGDVPATADDAMRFLDLTFPEMGQKVDDDGSPVLDKDGDPKYEMINNPFAKQIAEFAGSQANRMGNAKSG
jgi:hypothetical protein